MVRRRARCIEVDGLNKGTWTEEEDAKLAAYVKKHGQVNWRALPKLAGLKRCGKSCRLRWINYLRPDVKRGNFTKDEEEIIIRLHALLGNKWSKISSCLPGRTDNEIKNMWHTHLKKRLIQAAGKSSSSAPPPRKIKTRRLTQAACDNNGAAAVGSGAAGLIEKLLTSLPKPCPSYSTDLETKESTVRCMEQGQSQHILSSDHVLNCLAMESCVASPGLLHDQPWWPLQQEQQYLYGHAVDQGDSYCQMIEMYSLSVDPEEVWRHMEEDNYCLLPPSTPVAPDQVLVDSVQGAGCSNIINVPSWSTSSCSSTWDEEKDQWLEYLEKELEL